MNLKFNYVIILLINCVITLDNLNFSKRGNPDFKNLYSFNDLLTKE